MRRLAFVAVAAALSLSACATSTPYQPANQATSGRGYFEQRLEGARWRVSFSGNSDTSRQTVETYLLYRAAELTVQNGYDWFVPVNQMTDANRSFHGNFESYGPYWRPAWNGSVDVSQTTEYLVSAEILMGHGPKPPFDPRAMDAREVMRNIGPNVVRPGSTK